MKFKRRYYPPSPIFLGGPIFAASMYRHIIFHFWGKIDAPPYHFWALTKKKFRQKSTLRKNGQNESDEKR